MVTEILIVDPVEPDRTAIARAAACLRRGGLVAFPTETVYGLGAHALDRTAVARLFEVKGRPPNDPLIVHVAALEEAAALVTRVPDAARDLAARFWPGPLTLVFPRAEAVPTDVTAGLDTVAIRVPAHPVAHALLVAARLPIAAPSANLFSRPSPTRAIHVVDDLGGRIDMVLDAGPTSVGVESTVLDLTQDPPVVLRPGAVTVEALRGVVPSVRVRPPGAAASGAMASPGLLDRHYAPRTPMTLYDGRSASTRAALVEAIAEAVAAGRRVGLLATSEHALPVRHLPVVIADLGSERDPGQVASRLYAALRELDAAQLDLIVAQGPETDEGLWRAVHDRLRRAATRVVGS
ncbi:MAG: threonylcarbamoyl-AMP synthase [Acidobacteria bacterium RIFCSPLOWO2_02_FULL_68_18]|nr:MAG: threonylcarbamoyl-AMP synthase [Acidobacteria bacterium RIFCSPLOWO2_02_FULL_68_18]OFW49128.1 MAG: threonylcarbamoyl-AMP synthase [Acidobacteria bacterium RIFCSPLOWO2_12_FULL_68_19]